MPLLLIWKFLSTYNLPLIEQVPNYCLYRKTNFLDLGVLNGFNSVRWLKTPASQGLGAPPSVETTGVEDAHWYYLHGGRHKVYLGKAAGGGRTVKCFCFSAKNKST